MKINDIKHNHSLTDLLKVILFSILMILPFLSVASRCLYVICNKNAKDSYYGETINEVVYNQTNINDLKHNQEYLLDFNNVPIQSSSTNATDIACYELKIQTGNNVATFENVTIRMYVTSSSLQLYYQLLNYTPSTNGTITNQKITFKYNSIVTNTNATNRLLNNYLYSISYNDYSYLDNAFEYSVNKLEDNNLFNWVENTGVYTGVKAMTDNLQIDMLVIPMIVTYWFLLTVIYVIIDLILKAFTTLTHMLIKKA